MEDDPLVSHLIDILMQPEYVGIILSGGFGLRVKQFDLQRRRAATLISGLPEARATSDLDIILKLDLWLQPEIGRQFHDMLRRLGYNVSMHNWQFRKPNVQGSGMYVKVELQARTPTTDEPIKIRKERRPRGLRQAGVGMGTGLGALVLDEGFAVYDQPTQIDLNVGDNLGRC